MATDAEFDALAAVVDMFKGIPTGHNIMDAWFAAEFSAHTGSWVHSHPELDKLAALYERLIKGGLRARMKRG